MPGGNLGEVINTKFCTGVHVGYVMSLVIFGVDISREKNSVRGQNSGFPLYFVFGPNYCITKVLP